MKKGILIIVEAVLAFILIRMFVIVVVLLTTPEGEMHRQGLITGHKGDWEAAIVHFDKVIEMKPHHEKAYTTRAFAKSQLGDHRGAIEDSRIAIQKYPFYGESYAVLGMAEIQSGEKKSGCKDLNTALDLGYEQAKQYINQFCD
ncbi:MAG: hypothetical protein KAI07_08330 [Deltaproteobacteria bacterium]|nr:hypothetical protein [Deltaproteobacteria bacterium]